MRQDKRQDEQCAGPTLPSTCPEWPARAPAGLLWPSLSPSSLLHAHTSWPHSSKPNLPHIFPTSGLQSTLPRATSPSWCALYHAGFACPIPTFFQFRNEDNEPETSRGKGRGADQPTPTPQGCVTVLPCLMGAAINAFPCIQDSSLPHGFSNTSNTIQRLRRIREERQVFIFLKVRKINP